MRDGRRDSGDGYWKKLDGFLRTNPNDPGCSICRLGIDSYAELTVSGDSPAARFPGVAAHLESCAECRDELDGLVAAISCGSD